MTVRNLNSVLVANRGEIACRVFRTAKARGMRTIAVYSEADRDALHVRMADEAHPIGPASAAQSYLRGDAIIAAALRAGADCIHPGYGFLSEKPDFADACVAAGLVFVGPPGAAIRAMGLKDAAKRLVEAAGVPVVPGYHGDRQEAEFLRAKAAEIGYPVLVKAVAGGGGKGMRRVDDDTGFSAALESARREAQNAFGDPRVLIERYVLAPRHIEIQIFADGHGNVVSLFERDCSLQRRHQKVIEEAPAPGITPEMRALMGMAATDAARAVGYVGAGTVEFIADGREGLRADRFFFMEMNTRLQVEHPITEAITGLDLVDLQFRVASGEALPFGAADLAIKGHAVEARLYAEDPSNGFLPSTGTLWAFQPPVGEGIRVDTGVREGDAVTPFYDPMIAKVIAHGATRDEALDRLSAALGRTLIAGPRTNTAFLRALCDAPMFRSGAFDTGFIERDLATLVAKPDMAMAVAAAVMRLTGLDSAVVEADPWAARDAFQLGAARRQTLPITVDGERRDAVLSFDARGGVAVDGLAVSPRMTLVSSGVTLVASPDGVHALAHGGQVRVALHDPFAVDLDQVEGGDGVKAPMHGKLVALFVAPGDRVKKGQRLAIVEAMKMEHALLAPIDGTVQEVLAEAGAQVAEGARLVTLNPDAAEA